MNRSDLRGIVETILTSEDPTLRAGDRLRAAEMLRDLDDGPSLDVLIAESTATLDGDELDAWTDSALAALVLATGDEQLRERWPETARVLDERIVERANALQYRQRSQQARRSDERSERDSSPIPSSSDRRTAPIASAIPVQNSSPSQPSARPFGRSRARGDTDWHPL